MENSSLSIFTARDAKTRFGEVLDESLSQPVGISRHHRLVAYMVSKRDYDGMVNRLVELEDKLWLIQADQARAGGYASAERVEAFLRSSTRTPLDELEDNEPST